MFRQRLLHLHSACDGLRRLLKRAQDSLPDYLNQSALILGEKRKQEVVVALDHELPLDVTTGREEGGRTDNIGGEDRRRALESGVDDLVQLFSLSQYVFQLSGFVFFTHGGSP